MGDPDETRVQTCLDIAIVPKIASKMRFHLYGTCGAPLLIASVCVEGKTNTLVKGQYLEGIEPIQYNVLRLRWCP